jgi:ubiquinone/menaquinone biosynthesis C-methylase UbiE
MTNPLQPGRNEYGGTYFVQDRQNQREMRRLIVQDQMVTRAMGGVLPEQPAPASFQRILDIGCGTGGWLLELAETYPTISLAGIDINRNMIEYARERALARNVAERTEFRVMDALLILEFPPAYFDLVNLRFSISFMRTWDWPKMLSGMLRVARPDGVIRITDNDILHHSNSPALTQLDEIAICALHQAGHLFTREGTGLTAHLARLLQQHGCQQVQTQSYALEFRTGTEAGQAYYEDMAHVFQTTRPFIQKWGCAPADYDAIYQRALQEMQQPDFHSTWNLLTAWGRVPA